MSSFTHEATSFLWPCGTCRLCQWLVAQWGYIRAGVLGCLISVSLTLSSRQHQEPPVWEGWQSKNYIDSSGIDPQTLCSLRVNVLSTEPTWYMKSYHYEECVVSTKVYYVRFSLLGFLYWCLLLKFLSTTNVFGHTYLNIWNKTDCELTGRLLYLNINK